MNPLTIKDTLCLILHYLPNKDKYSLILSSNQTRSLFSNVEFYELVGWQVLADMSHKEGLKYFEVNKALQESDILYHYFRTDQPSKLTSKNLNLIYGDCGLTAANLVRSKSYEMIDLVWKTFDAFDSNVNNPNSIKYAFDHNIRYDKTDIKYLRKMDCLRLLLDHPSFDYNLLKSIRIGCCDNLQFFLFLETIYGTGKMQEFFKDEGGTMLLNCDDVEMVSYVRNKYEVEFVIDEILEYALMSKPLALELIKDMNVHAINLSNVYCSYFLKFHFPQCKKIFSEKQIQYLFSILDIEIVSDEDEFLTESLIMIYEYDPNKAKELFLHEIRSLANCEYVNIYGIANLYDTTSSEYIFFMFGIDKGWLNDKKVCNEFFNEVFVPVRQENLFLFCTVLKMIDPKVDITNVVSYNVTPNGYELIKNTSC